jgi:hypothetical protein
LCRFETTPAGSRRQPAARFRQYLAEIKAFGRVNELARAVLIAGRAED